MISGFQKTGSRDARESGEFARVEVAEAFSEISGRRPDAVPNLLEKSPIARRAPGAREPQDAVAHFDRELPDHKLLVASGSSHAGAASLSVPSRRRRIPVDAVQNASETAFIEDDQVRISCEKARRASTEPDEPHEPMNLMNLMNQFKLPS
jgi:hypothetical protein